jgi:uncharacterized membrane protein YjgN (DUF898 family)
MDAANKNTVTQFEFTGSAGEYFRIWIVNVFLTIITLGIYSAWAKVRRNRYLYSSVRLAGAPFEYLANPVQILKGRLIAVGLLVIYSVAGHFSRGLQSALFLVFLGFLPWLVIRARAFALHNTAYRNIRFGFKAGYGDALGVFVLWPILIGLSAGLLYPRYVWRRSKFMIDNSRFGSQQFAFGGRKGAFFLAYLRFLVLLGVVLAIGIAAVTGAMAGPLEATGGGSIAGAMLALLATVLALLATLSYIHVAVTNLVWSNVEVGGVSTRSELETFPMYWIALTSLIGIILSFGLLIPWATIRMTRYRIEHTSLLNAEQLPALLSAETTQVGAAGEELSDLLGLDIAV